MDERNLLLTSILNNPDDTAVRGVYADWLDEHAKKGNGFKQLAKVIRWQCKYSDIKPSNSDMLVAVRTQLRKLDRVIKIKSCGYFNRVRNSIALEGSIDRDYVRFVISRGFIETIDEAWVAGWAGYGPFIVTLVPVDCIWFCNAPLRNSYLNGREVYWYRNPFAIDLYGDAYEGIYAPWLNAEEPIVRYASKAFAEEWFSSTAIGWAKREAEEGELYGRAKFTFS